MTFFRSPNRLGFDHVGNLTISNAIGFVLEGGVGGGVGGGGLGLMGDDSNALIIY